MVRDTRPDKSDQPGASDDRTPQWHHDSIGRIGYLPRPTIPLELTAELGMMRRPCRGGFPGRKSVGLV
jgi:hypothetical protein